MYLQTSAEPDVPGTDRREGGLHSSHQAARRTLGMNSRTSGAQWTKENSAGTVQVDLRTIQAKTGGRKEEGEQEKEGETNKWCSYYSLDVSLSFIVKEG